VSAKARAAKPVPRAKTGEAGTTTRRAKAPARPSSLFERVAAILEEARGAVVRAVNTGMVTAYWLIGKEIVEAVQAGAPRGRYGEGALDKLARRLRARYGAGYSVANLKNFRQLYLVYADRRPEIRYPSGSGSSRGMKRYPSGSVSTTSGFHPSLSWSHYRALMRVESPHARAFYEAEAATCGWTKSELERQIATLYYERALGSRDKRRALALGRSTSGEAQPIDVLREPYVLEFLALPDSPVLYESTLEQAIIDNLQGFLLELGKGFAFVARQKRIRLDDEEFYVDLVFYNYLLRCFVLIDLKVGKLTHQDIGQMDTYVRLYEAHERQPGDNPTIGLILCSQKNEAVAKYSVLSENEQLFAARYVTHLPSEAELRRELMRERKRIEERLPGGAPAPKKSPGKRSGA
jgi:predicted nuclease of restriction endonuclease-like (RecB) superfamily